MSGIASQEKYDLEGELLAMRNLLSSQATLECSLAESGAPNSTSNTSKADTRNKVFPHNDLEPIEVCEVGLGITRHNLASGRSFPLI